MNVFAVVPVKALDASKRRLSSVLNPEKRRVLTAAMLLDVLKALKSSVVREVLVVSTDSAVQRIIDKRGVSYLAPKRAGLNPSLKEAIDWCMQRQADSVLILPADLPLVSAEDINRMVLLGAEQPTVVLSPSLSGGTNALFLNPPNLITVCFGSNSFFKHVKEAGGKRVAIKFYSSKGTTLDIDSEDDLNRAMEIEGDVASKQVLKNTESNLNGSA